MGKRINITMTNGATAKDISDAIGEFLAQKEKVRYWVKGGLGPENFTGYIDADKRE